MPHQKMQFEFAPQTTRNVTRALMLGPRPSPRCRSRRLPSYGSMVQHDAMGQFSGLVASLPCRRGGRVELVDQVSLPRLQRSLASHLTQP